MKAADKKIIEANPDATPHDLWTVHGLSESGFNELVAQMDDSAARGQTYKPTPVLKPANILQPTLSTHDGRAQTVGDVVTVIPPKGGLGQPMNRKDAESLVRHDPKYKIV